MWMLPRWYSLAACAACLATSSRGADARLRIEPNHIVLAGRGAAQRYVVSATDGAGREVDITETAEVSPADPAIAAVDRARGIIASLGAGRTRIVARYGGASASSDVEVRDQPADVSVHFSPDVISILTTKGCNGSGCHGSPAGQSGFKLSLFGYNIESDHDMIVKAGGGRRVDLRTPEDSLLLKKPSFRVPHGGGRVLPPESEEYRTILNWLKQGARLDSGGVRLTRLEMYPRERILVGTGRKQRFAVIGRLSDGTTRDMTREVRYSVLSDGIVSVEPDGALSASGEGLTAVLARAMGHVAAAQIGVIASPPGSEYTNVAGNNFIDDLVFAKLRSMNVRPYPLSSDQEFIRRVSLDAIGTLPSVNEVREFVADPRANKRSILIDRLLARDEYASFWTVIFEDWFRNCQLNSQGRSMGKFKEWIRDWVARDRPYDQVVRELLTSEGDTSRNPAANFWHPATDFMLKKFDVNKITPTVSRLFLGIRLECAECHNHPLENFTQDDFYGVAAFFARLRVKHGYAEYRRTWFLDDDGELTHPVTKQIVRPKLLGAEAPPIQPNMDRRAVLAHWITSPGNPYFARATVNRIWAHYFDSGIVEPFDDFRSTNVPSNGALLDALARQFTESGFSLKAVHRAILNSRAYQLSSSDPATGRVPKPIDRVLFAGYAPRKLSAEVLLDAVSQVTAVAHPFRNYPEGTRALDLYAPEAPDYFLVAFGFPRRDVLADRSKSPTLSQALHLMNGESVMSKVADEHNVLSQCISQSDSELVTTLYERAYARPPTEKELAGTLAFVRSEQKAGRSRRRAFEGVLWAILNSKEFQLNR
jgi:hypothetical protein